MIVVMMMMMMKVTKSMKINDSYEHDGHDYDEDNSCNNDSYDLPKLSTIDR